MIRPFRPYALNDCGRRRIQTNSGSRIVCFPNAASHLTGSGELNAEPLAAVVVGSVSSIEHHRTHWKKVGIAGFSPDELVEYVVPEPVGSTIHSEPFLPKSALQKMWNAFSARLSVEYGVLLRDR